jgi:2-keto-4-pentenoate hydratase/2-oxohepta-3-ene-1,7-dioic acid hydratase in catechol pathway
VILHARPFLYNPLAGEPFPSSGESTMTSSKCGLLVCVIALLTVTLELRAADRFARFRAGETTAYGIVEGDRIRQLSGDLFGSWTKSDKTFSLAEVKLLPPTAPTQVLALAGNYKSHLRDAVIPEKFRIPQPFFKSPSCLIADGENIVIPAESAGRVHYEAELVIVIGKKTARVPKDKALEHVFGVTCGNDVSERYWQNDEQAKDVQWWRAKGADTFGPVGPFIARGLDYDNLMLRLKLNGQVKQEERTNQLIHDIASTVSFISRHVTMHPGDLIFTGTPGTTAAIKPGDVVEVELEGVGVLRNPVVAEK